MGSMNEEDILEMLNDILDFIKNEIREVKAFDQKSLKQLLFVSKS